MNLLIFLFSAEGYFLQDPLDYKCNFNLKQQQEKHNGTRMQLQH